MSFPRNAFIEKARELGHSEEYIEECLTYADRLDQQRLPVIFDYKHLAILMGHTSEELAAIIRTRHTRYKVFTIQKRNGGRRRIMAPYNDIKALQLFIKNAILDKLSHPSYVTAFTKGRSIVSNAKMHEAQAYIKKYDIENFFESISIYKVCNAFNRIGYDNIVSWRLAEICTTYVDKDRYTWMQNEKPEAAELVKDLVELPPFLVQGAPTSPQVANLVCYRLDKRLQGLANKLGCSYSRYADDITFSCSEKNMLPKDYVIKSILRQEGFNLNKKKTSLSHKGQQQKVTGLLVDDHVRVPGAYKRDVFRHLRFCLKYGGRSHFHRISPDLAYGKEWLQGRILFVHSVEPEVAKTMMEQFDKVDWWK